MKKRLFCGMIMGLAATLAGFVFLWVMVRPGNGIEFDGEIAIQGAVSGFLSGSLILPFFLNSRSFSVKFPWVRALLGGLLTALPAVFVVCFLVSIWVHYPAFPWNVTAVMALEGNKVLNILGTSLFMTLVVVPIFVPWVYPFGMIGSLFTFWFWRKKHGTSKLRCS